MLAVLAEIAKFVELGVKTVADDARIRGESGRFVGKSTFEAFADVRKFIDFVEEKTKKRAATGRRRREEIAQDGKLRERFAKSEEFARRSEAERYAAGEALEILNTFEFLADFAPDDGLLDELRDGVEAGFDGFAVNERTK